MQILLGGNYANPIGGYGINFIEFKYYANPIGGYRINYFGEVNLFTWRFY